MIDEENEYRKIREAAHLMRGLIISEISELEIYIDFYISDYFGISRDKADEFYLIILQGLRVGLSAKKDIVIQIMTNLKIIDNYPNIDEDLKSLILDRNIFAHALLDTSPNALIAYNQREILFYKKEKGHGTPKVYNNEKFQNLIRKYKELFKNLTVDKWNGSATSDITSAHQ